MSGQQTGTEIDGGQGEDRGHITETIYRGADQDYDSSVEDRERELDIISV